MPVSLSRLTVQGSAIYGVLIFYGSIDHVAVDATGPGSSGESGILLSHATVKDSTVRLPAGSSGDGLLIDGGGFSSNEIDDVAVDGGDRGVSASVGAVIHRARLTGSATSVVADSASIYIDDSLLAGGGIEAYAPNDFEGSILAVNDTIVAEGSASTGALSMSISSGYADIKLYNSIVHGFPTSFKTSGDGVNAMVESANGNYDGTTSGSAINISDTVAGDPTFVDPGTGDYHLAWTRR